MDKAGQGRARNNLEFCFWVLQFNMISVGKWLETGR
jgi:hypothetical protein